MNWLFAAGIANAIGFAFRALLEELAKRDLAAYSRLFFKEYRLDGLNQKQQEQLEIALGQALRIFLEQIQQELEDADIANADLRLYNKALKELLHHPTVLHELAKPFHQGTFNDQRLVAVWQELGLRPLPSQFSWVRVARRYDRKIEAMLRESEALRSLLEQTVSVSDYLQAEQAKAPANLSLTKGMASPSSSEEMTCLIGYRSALETAYASLRLDTFDTTGYRYSLKLWNIFVAPHVREIQSLLPLLYELPPAYWVHLRQAGHPSLQETDPESLERARSAYWDQTAQSVLTLLQNRQDYRRVVVLGNPGSGKSSLLQYLALQWAEMPLPELRTLPLPILAELRGYTAIVPTDDPDDLLTRLQLREVVDFPWSLAELRKNLRQGKVLLLLDGLDEIFDDSSRDRAIADILDLAHQYPAVQIIVTSRVVGYDPQPLQKGGFRHLLLQELEPSQIDEFINRWHDLAFDQMADKVHKRHRLRQAIEHSPVIRQFATNPLLLTMMAILNRSQELPRDRAELYSQASRVLLQQWDVESGIAGLTSITVDYKDKQAILRRVAFHMQNRPSDLAGNVISATDLTQLLCSYLATLDIAEPLLAARRMLEQLRTRNFILSFLGAETFAFVHRTFLEYFCAWEYVWQFEKERRLTLDDLQQQVFAAHWQDETWHEILRLIAGMLDAPFVGQLIEFLMAQDGVSCNYANLFLAADLLTEVRNRAEIAVPSGELLIRLTALVLHGPVLEAAAISDRIISTIATTWRDAPDTLASLKGLAQSPTMSVLVRRSAIREIARGWSTEPETLAFLYNLALTTEEPAAVPIQEAVIQELAEVWRNNYEVCVWLQQQARQLKSPEVRATILHELAGRWEDDAAVLSLLQDRAIHDPDPTVRAEALEELAITWSDPQAMVIFFRDRADNDPQLSIRQFAQAKLNSFTFQ